MLRSYSAIPTPQSHPLPSQVALFFINRLYYMDTSRRIRNRIFFCLHITGPVPYNRLCCKAMEDYPSGRRGRTRNALGRSNGARVRIPCPPCIRKAWNVDFSMFQAFSFVLTSLFLFGYFWLLPGYIGFLKPLLFHPAFTPISEYPAPAAHPDAARHICRPSYAASHTP